MGIRRGEFFDAAEVARLRRPHPFRSVDLSWISRLLEPFWSALAVRVPSWVAPNAITLAGFLGVAFAFAAMMTASPRLAGPVPPALYLAAIVSIFAFQTLDAIDGKQARRTGSSSALGSWFDHACDVAAVQLAMATAAASVGLGRGGWTLFLLGSVVFNNYVIHWETRHTGILHMGNGTSIYEAQLMMIVVHAITLGAGTEVWGRTIAELVPAASSLPFAEAPVRLWVVVLGVGFIGGLGVLGSVVRVRRAGQGRAAVFGELVAPAVLCAGGGVAVRSVDEAIALPLVFSVSALGLRLIAQQILGQLAGTRVRALDPMLAPLLASALAFAAFGGVIPRPVAGVVGWANLAFALWVTASTYLGATFGIARALGVPILTLPKARSSAIV